MSELPPTPDDSSLPADHSWQSALAEFVSTRVELIRLESQEAAKVAKKRTSLTITLAIIASTAWLSFIAGIIGLTDQYSSITWWMAALAAAALHAIIAGILISKLKQPTPPLFTVTRSEFQKDRLWMQHLKTPKSND
jgi:uncharacterized membrane protein YqjE